MNEQRMPSTDGHEIPVDMLQPRIPVATYRLQLHAGFTFHDAEQLVPYLSRLGISDLYASPVLQAPAQSMHGYDQCDPSQLNPALGGEEAFAALSRALRTRNMGLLLDTVPNHMGVADVCNRWWTDVLENGPGSLYAPFFDITWQPEKPELANKVLLPILEAQYGYVLESGKLRLEYRDGSFWITYGPLRLPVNPRSYDMILRQRLDALTEMLGADDEHIQELQSILTAINYLPGRAELDPARLAERSREKEIIKRRIAMLCAGSPEIRAAIDAAVGEFNGTPGDADSFDLLDDLIARQSYRPAFWRVAGEEINYRRFFDVNGLAAVRVELSEVFEATHGLVLDLAASGTVTGLRIDHPDGLWDPSAYFHRLQDGYLRRRLGTTWPVDETSSPTLPVSPSPTPPLPLYVVAEKILTETEPLPKDWAVNGTTGYDFLASVNGLFVNRANERSIDRTYTRFIGRRIDFAALIITTKTEVMRSALVSEINALGHNLERLAERNRMYRDFTLRGLTAALRRVIACLGVYRTYNNAPARVVAPRDRQFIEEAVQEAQRRDPETDESIFDFIRDTLLLRTLDDFSLQDQIRLGNWVMKFQQVTGPVMAKGVEDTAYYVYNRLVSLNEVGGDPRQFGTSVVAFHRANAERMRDWPHSLVATSTHDTKRSEDVRARIDVISELPEQWRAALMRWTRFNASKKTPVGGKAAPDRNDEYLLYQTLLGAWPLVAGVREPATAESVPAALSAPVRQEATASAPGPSPATGVVAAPAADPWECLLQADRSDEFARFRERIAAYMLKATKEAKVHTSWIRPDEEYDAALARFVTGILDAKRSKRFLKDLIALLRPITYYGQFNSLSQVLLKLTSPGVPDLYQGNELWDFSLVDPDNRRPVDYEKRQSLLAELQQQIPRSEGKKSSPRLEALAQELLRDSADGRIKLYVTYRALSYRRDHRALFEDGAYLPIEVSGGQREHAVAFARAAGDDAVVVVAPRLAAGLGGDMLRPPVGPDVWGDTRIVLPAGLGESTYRNIFTGETMAVQQPGRPALPLATVLGRFPVALLAKADIV